MTSSNTLKKIISLGASLLLAVGGSLAAAAPAQAVPNTVSTDAGLYTAWNSSTATTWQTGSYSPVMALKLTMSSALANIAKFDVMLGSGSGPIMEYGVTTGSSCKINNWYHPSWDTTLNCQVLGGGTPGKIRYTPGGSFSLASGDAFIIAYLAGAWDNSGQQAGSKFIQVDFLDSSDNVIGQATGTFAITAPPRFTATLNANGGTLGSITSVQGDSNGNVTFPNPSNAGAFPTRTGFNLSGWSSNQNATTGNYQGVLTTDTTYYAIWISSNNNNSNNQSAPTQLIAPTIAVVGTSAVVTSGTYSSGTVMANWEYCLAPKTAVTTIGSMFANDCGPLFVTQSGGSNYSNVAHGLTLDLTATYYARPLNSMSSVLSAISLAGKFVRYQEFVNNGFFTATVPAVAGATTSTDSTDVTDPITEDKRPLPVWASNIVKSIPTLTKSLHTTGGAVALTDGDYADLKSVTIGGQAVTFKIESTGNVSIPVPAGQAGKTADIVIVFAGGTMTVQDGIKYVAQTDVATVVERPIAIAAGAKKLTEAVADQIRQAAFANMTNTNVQCVAYASKNTVAAKAAAKLTAIQACGIAAAANPSLKVSEVSVIVNKVKAKKQAVGIKVYK
jgi:hypothetical protein